jgi:tRNA pseudouridine55 synthase
LKSRARTPGEDFRFQITKLRNYQITKSRMNGVLIIDKPSGLTSHDVVNRVRRVLGQRSVGHLGTLDPMATGVLPLVLGNYTRLAQFYTDCEKTYEGAIRFGFSTDTYDAEGKPTSPPQPANLTLDELQQLAIEFRGHIQQLPPPFSAKKIHGVPAYKLARKHKEVELKPIQVEIKEFTISAIEGELASFRARVASGTYLRSVAHDMGHRLGCGSHLASLRRTAVAEFDITHAHTLEKLEVACNICHSDRSMAFPQEKQCEVEEPAFAGPAGKSSDRETAGNIESLLIHPRQLLPQFPSVTADELAAAHICNGRPVNLPDHSRSRLIKVFANQRDLLAIATRIAGTLFHPKIVLAPEPRGTEGAFARCPL